MIKYVDFIRLPEEYRVGGRYQISAISIEPRTSVVMHVYLGDYPLKIYACTLSGCVELSTPSSTGIQSSERLGIICPESDPSRCIAREPSSLAIATSENRYTLKSFPFNIQIPLITRLTMLLAPQASRIAVQQSGDIPGCPGCGFFLGLPRENYIACRENPRYISTILNTDKGTVIRDQSGRQQIIASYVDMLKAYGFYTGANSTYYRDIWAVINNPYNDYATWLPSHYSVDGVYYFTNYLGGDIWIYYNDVSGGILNPMQPQIFQGSAELVENNCFAHEVVYEFVAKFPHGFRRYLEAKYGSIDSKIDLYVYAVDRLWSYTDYLPSFSNFFRLDTVKVVIELYDMNARLVRSIAIKNYTLDNYFFGKTVKDGYIRDGTLPSNMTIYSILKAVEMKCEETGNIYAQSSKAVGYRYCESYIATLTSIERDINPALEKNWDPTVNLDLSSTDYSMIRVKIYYLKIGPMYYAPQASISPCTVPIFTMFCKPAAGGIFGGFPRLGSGEQLIPDPFVVVIAGIAVKPKLWMII
jgi:hypothetical protein